MRLGPGAVLVSIGMVGIASNAAGALSRKDPPTDCPAGTTWHEEEDLARYTSAADETPGRVGWCERADGTRHGAMRMWWASGWLKSETTFVDGVESGPVQTFYADGTPQLQTTHREGKPEGRYVHWHPNGKRARLMHYDVGRPHGWAQFWADNGQLIAQGAFVDSHKEGTWEAWHANGVLREVARYEAGRLHGRQLTFTEGGVFLGGACWERGERRWDTRSEVEARTRSCRPY